jgi:hypothetical protein
VGPDRFRVDRRLSPRASRPQPFYGRPRPPAVLLESVRGARRNSERDRDSLRVLFSLSARHGSFQGGQGQARIVGRAHPIYAVVHAAAAAEASELLGLGARGMGAVVRRRPCQRPVPREAAGPSGLIGGPVRSRARPAPRRCLLSFTRRARARIDTAPTYRLRLSKSIDGLFLPSRLHRRAASAQTISGVQSA